MVQRHAVNRVLDCSHRTIQSRTNAVPDLLCPLDRAKIFSVKIRIPARTPPLDSISAARTQPQDLIPARSQVWFSLFTSKSLLNTRFCAPTLTRQ